MLEDNLMCQLERASGIAIAGGRDRAEVAVAWRVGSEPMAQDVFDFVRA